MNKTSTTTLSAHIRRLWGNTPVRDATVALALYPLPEDCTRATAKNPGLCVAAYTGNRTLGTEKMLFFRQIAYIEKPQGKKSVVERHIMAKDLRGFIDAFDKAKSKKTKAAMKRFMAKYLGKAYLLLPPTKSQTLDYSSEHWRKWDRKRTKAERKRRQPSRSAALVGTSLTRSTPVAIDPLVLDELEVRQGKGMVHFKMKG